jgi:hypothetical protein
MPSKTGTAGNEEISGHIDYSEGSLREASSSKKS